MDWAKIRAFVITGAAIAVVGAAVVAGHDEAKGATPKSSELVQQTVVIDPGLADGNLRSVLDPPPSGTTDQALTAQQAMSAFKTVDPQYVTSNDSTAQLGLYTASIGSGTYSFKSQLAWAFSHQAECPPSPDPFGPASPQGECIDWLLLDAQTGQMLEEVFEPVTPPASSPTSSLRP